MLGEQCSFDAFLAALRAHNSRLWQHVPGTDIFILQISLSMDDQ
jgi:hypothetical protein